MDAVKPRGPHQALAAPDAREAPGAIGVAVEQGTAHPAAALDDVTFTYAGGDRAALSHVTFALGAGEMIGVMGASGAGKSTLVKCLNRIVPAFEDGAFSGVVRIGGRVLGDERVCDAAPIVGMVFQDFEAQLFSTNAAHEIAFAMEQVGMPREEIAARIAPALAAVGLIGFDDRDPTSLSGGEKQRLAIAAVLALRPAVVALDEPTTDLDPEGKAEVFALIRRMRSDGLSLVVIEHEAEELRGCDRIVILREGEIIVHGAPAEVMTRLDLLEDCGVHPPDLNRVLSLLGIAAHAASIDEAEALIRARYTNLPARGASIDSGGAPALADPLAAPTDDRASAPPIVAVRDLSFAYPYGPRVLDGVSLTIAAGEFVAIIGQNGSGKTTLAKHLVGLLAPAAGTIMIDGRDRAALRPAETAATVGYVFQNPDHQIFAATVADEVAFGPRNFGLDAAEIARRSDEVLRAVNLDTLGDRDPFLLSKGERQRLAVASVLALRPRMLILDEPTTGLDYREQRRMMALVGDLNRAGIAIVMITHTPWLVAEYARRVVLMRHGRVTFDGAVRTFLARDDLLAGSSFRAPEATALGRRFGVVALGPAELAAWIKGRA
ncbi:MAG TPA: energy-coupling factor transporter ATPase [Candidatus Binataceae bacterium]|nr:energy-coupling factor transporter ATPase [Candidatus Binataceae bacterium]